MAQGRKGAPGSFGAPLDELLPKFGQPDQPRVSVDVHRKPEQAADERQETCRIFILNQKLFEAAQPQR
ncbi:hypothetical protein G7077_03500 [Sphingomonas piscis]|uniref:Uncharacterized protein n=1 Tax=Sphingomonas piscis TaxID=2714943 RepID=A0A6G7YMZ3_9SPHN|nr:hypothetical protein [Sphingomonas piscis]QIK78115.1 hypothetical protein G7077_03500 [Sphingomonas piscis]